MIKSIVKAMTELEEETLYEEVKKAAATEADSLEIVASLQKGMEAVGDLFSKNEYFLGELMLSAELFKNCQELMGSGGDTSEAVYGKFILGTVYGDVHDIGKNIVSTVFSCNGFEVIDLGVDVKPETFIAAIKEHSDAKVIGLSCLLTTAFDALKDCVGQIRDAGLDKGRLLMIGGGPVNQRALEYSGADVYTINAQEGFEKARAFVSQA
jgi:methylmalonyl-CoA mutase cobalamin-binding domain/chain